MDSSIQQNRRFLEWRSNNYKVNRNVPLDCRFIVTSLSAVNTEIPLRLRYNGLIFYLVTATRNNGTADIAMGRFYYFGDDLNTPKPLEDIIYDYKMIFYDDTSITDYSSILTNLNKSYAIPGRIVWFKKLQIAVIYDGKTSGSHVWKYLTGTHHVDTDASFNTLPSTFKVSGNLVLVGTGTGTVRKITLAALTLSTEVITLTTYPASPTTLEHDRYYFFNNRLYLSIGNNLYLISDGMYYNTSVLINAGTTNVQHNLASNYILVQAWLTVPLEYHSPSFANGVTVANKYIPYDIEYDVVSENILSIHSLVQTTISIIVTTKFKS